jgi:hypothetical protein
MIYIRKLGLLFKRAHILQRERTPAWAVALASVLYPMGLSLRKLSQYLSLHEVERAHTAIWYWLQKLAAGRKPAMQAVFVDAIRVG